MAEYFQQFPTILYSFDPESIDFYTVRNIFARVKIIDDILDNSLVYYTYNWQEGDTAEMIAHKYYGDAKRHWIVMFSNKILDPYFDFPLNDSAFQLNISKKYGSASNAQANLHHVEKRLTISTNYFGNVNTTYSNTTLNAAYTYDFSSDQVQTYTLPNIANPIISIGSNTTTLSDGSVVTVSGNLVAVSNYDYEYNLNESRRQIRLLDKTYAAALESELKNLLKT